MLPKVAVCKDAAPVKTDDGDEVAVPFDTPTELNVVAAGTYDDATPPAWVAAVVAGTRAADAVVAPW